MKKNILFLSLLLLLNVAYFGYKNGNRKLLHISNKNKLFLLKNHNLSCNEERLFILLQRSSCYGCIENIVYICNSLPNEIKSKITFVFLGDEDENSFFAEQLQLNDFDLIFKSNISIESIGVEKLPFMLAVDEKDNILFCNAIGSEMEPVMTRLKKYFL